MRPVIAPVGSVLVAVAAAEAEGSRGDIHEPSPGRTACALDWVHECPLYCLRRACLMRLPGQLVDLAHSGLVLWVIVNQFFLQLLFLKQNFLSIFSGDFSLHL